MPNATESSTAGGSTAYDLSVRLAPFRDATVKRKTDETATISIELDARHAGLLIRLIPLGVDPYFKDSDDGSTGSADVYAVVHVDDSGGVPSLSALTDFPVLVDPTSGTEYIGVLGLDPDSTDDAGEPLPADSISSDPGSGTGSSSSSGSGSAASNTGGGGGDLVVPTDVVVRKKRIPIPPGTGRISSLVLPLVATGAFVAGVVVGAAVA